MCACVWLLVYERVFLCARSCVWVYDGLFVGVYEFGVSMYVFGGAKLSAVCVHLIYRCTGASLYVRKVVCAFVMAYMVGCVSFMLLCTFLGEIRFMGCVCMSDIRAQELVCMCAKLCVRL